MNSKNVLRRPIPSLWVTESALASGTQRGGPSRAPELRSVRLSKWSLKNGKGWRRLQVGGANQCGMGLRMREGAGMGLGWEVATVNGETILDHDGSGWGVRTFVDVYSGTRNRRGGFYQRRKRRSGDQESGRGSFSEPAIRGYDVSSSAKMPW
jgi:hypothetical protein